MTAVVHYLRTWRHYLLTAHFTIFTDNVVASCFATRKKLTLKHAWWQDFLTEFDFTLRYKPGQVNVVANTLSRQGTPTSLAVTSAAIGDIVNAFRSSYSTDPSVKQLLH